MGVFSRLNIGRTFSSSAPRVDVGSTKVANAASTRSSAKIERQRLETEARVADAKSRTALANATVSARRWDTAKPVLKYGAMTGLGYGGLKTYEVLRGDIGGVLHAAEDGLGGILKWMEDLPGEIASTVTGISGLPSTGTVGRVIEGAIGLVAIGGTLYVVYEVYRFVR